MQRVLEEPPRLHENTAAPEGSVRVATRHSEPGCHNRTYMGRGTWGGAHGAGRMGRGAWGRAHGAGMGACRERRVCAWVVQGSVRCKRAQAGNKSPIRWLGRYLTVRAIGHRGGVGPHSPGHRT